MYILQTVGGNNSIVRSRRHAHNVLPSLWHLKGTSNPLTIFFSLDVDIAINTSGSIDVTTIMGNFDNLSRVVGTTTYFFNTRAA